MSLKLDINRLVKACMKVNPDGEIWVGKHEPWLQHPDISWIDTSSKPEVLRRWDGDRWSVVKE